SERASALRLDEHSPFPVSLIIMIRFVWPLFLAAGLFAAELIRPTDISFRNEIQRAFEKGNDFLIAAQISNGWWSTPDHPSVTALVLSALVNEPNGRPKNPTPVKQ